MLCLGRTGAGIGSPGAGELCVVGAKCSEPNLGPLLEQQVILKAEPSHQTLVRQFAW